MNVRITVEAGVGSVSREFPMGRPGDLEKAIKDMLDEFRAAYPGAAVYDCTIRVEHA